LHFKDIVLFNQPFRSHEHTVDIDQQVMLI